VRAEGAKAQEKIEKSNRPEEPSLLAFATGSFKALRPTAEAQGPVVMALSSNAF
jgi:hypothetical protein